MTAYVRVREDAPTALAFGLVPGASYPLQTGRQGSASLRVITFSGERITVPRNIVEPFAPAIFA